MHRLGRETQKGPAARVTLPWHHPLQAMPAASAPTRTSMGLVAANVIAETAGQGTQHR